MSLRFTLDQLKPPMRDQALRKLAELAREEAERKRQQDAARVLELMRASEEKKKAEAERQRQAKLKPKPKPTHLEVAEAATKKLIWLLKAAGLPEPEREVCFYRRRRWRFDLAYPDKRIAIEIEGGIHGGRGRHIRPKGFMNDLHKYNEATICNWRVLRVTHAMIHDGRAVDLIERAYG